MVIKFFFAAQIQKQRKMQVGTYINAYYTYTQWLSLKKISQKFLFTEITVGNCIQQHRYQLFYQQIEVCFSRCQSYDG